MGRHESFTPPRPPDEFNGALESVNQGVERIFETVYAHRHAPNAALQMADALCDLMRPWVVCLPNVTATNLIQTSLARAIMGQMVHDPAYCAHCYNDAVERVPEAGIRNLLIRDDYVELPLWRIREDGRRMHAYDNDVAAALEANNPKSEIQNSKLEVDLLPRALFMTALVRLAMCDLFVHGTGGAQYDRTMEIWIRNWLGIEVGSIAIASANLRLPLLENVEHIELSAAQRYARMLWHDPESQGQQERPSRRKMEFLRQIQAAPRNSPERKRAFLQMHEELASARMQQANVQQARDRADQAARHDADLKIASRRDWAFPLYPREMIDDLAARAQEFASCGAPE